MVTSSSCRITMLATKFVYSVRLVQMMGSSSLTMISLLGFSRGAYTARALAGMLYKVLFAVLSVYFIGPLCQLGWSHRSAYSRKIIWSKFPLHTNSISLLVQVMKTSPGGSRRRSVALYPSTLLVSGGFLPLGAELSARNVNMKAEAIDRQGHGCERRNHNGPISSFCGCQHHN